MPASSYWNDSRAPRYSLLFALPLLVVYEVMAAALAGPQRGLRNGADVILQTLVASAVGRDGMLYVIGAVIVLCAAWVVRDARRHGGIGAIRPGYFPRMFLEAAALAVIFAIVVATATSQLLAGLGASLMTVDGAQAVAPVRLDTATAVMLSLGAGLYEELLFRVLLVTAIAAGMRALLGASTLTAGIVASVVGAIVFSAFHYVGAYGDTFTVQSFTFRAIAGLAFSGLYLTRGFGITAWTHALYDIGVMAL